jgi:glycosyltransferase involved in cell wall biosynthesis
MKITLITVCFNNKNTIGQTIRSVQSQTYVNIEHLIIDGASTDGTLDEIQRLKNEKTVVISEPDQGMYDAINKGLKRATGDIIGLLHSDDELYASDTLEQIVKHFQQSKADWVYGNGIFVDEVFTNQIIRNWISKPYKKWKIWVGWVPLHTSMYFTNDAFNQLGYYDLRYRIASDYEYSLRAITNLKLKVHYTGLYHVRMKMGGTSTSLKYQYPKSKEDFLIMLRYGLPAPFTLACKILRKIPQFFKK